MWRGHDPDSYPDARAVPGVILPAQYQDLVGCHTLTAEQRLMLAVLADALNIIYTWREAPELRKQRLFAEATEWIFAVSNNWPFSFDNVCAALGIDAGAVRSRVLRGEALGAPISSAFGPGRLRVKEAGRTQRITVNRVRKRSRRSSSQRPSHKSGGPSMRN